jgi:2-oxoglutarate dehydrogenase E2 component (dihydrolipoamide succinyltransferase)
MTVKIVVPDLGESVIEATVSEWLKKEGDTVAVGELVVVLETDKVDLEVAAEKAGVISQITQAVGADVQVGDVLGLIAESGEASESPAEPVPTEAAAAAPAPAEKSSGETVTPVARRMAQEEGIDLSKVSSESGSRITKEDVQRYIDQNKATETPAPAPVKAAAPAAPQSPASTSARDSREERVKMTRRRRTIARRLVEAQQTAAMLTTFNEVDMGAVMDLRKRRKDAFKERTGVSLGLSAFFVKASIAALKAFPLLNAEIEEDEIILKHYYDIGVAIGAEEGLVVPVLRDADRLSFAQIEAGIKDFAQKANSGSLSLEDLRGGNFTITNGGVFGSLLSTPILNPPQVAILGLHKIEERPIAVNGEVVIRPMMYLALSYDHRIVDGREAVQFLVKIKELVEDPESLLLEG